MNKRCFWSQLEWVANVRNQPYSWRKSIYRQFYGDAHVPCDVEPQRPTILFWQILATIEAAKEIEPVVAIPEPMEIIREEVMLLN